MLACQERACHLALHASYKKIGYFVLFKLTTRCPGYDNNLNCFISIPGSSIVTNALDLHLIRHQHIFTGNILFSNISLINYLVCVTLVKELFNEPLLAFSNSLWLHVAISKGSLTRL